MIVAINPGQQFASARDVTRESHINSLYNSLISYQVSNRGFSELNLPQEPEEICNTNLDPTPDCAGEGLVDLSLLVDEGHINQIPVDPRAEENGTGYEMAEGSVIIIAPLAETRFISLGITETEYAGTDNGEEGGNGEDFSCGDDFVDERDGEVYETVQIDDQCWFAENLNSGEKLTGFDAPSDNDVIEKYCYEDEDSNCDVYGGLYTWEEAMQYEGDEPNQGACPEGWVIPTDNDFHQLESYLKTDGESCDPNRSDFEEGWDCVPAGAKLREEGNNHWAEHRNDPCERANCNSSGFTLLPSGYRLPDGLSRRLGENALLWTSTTMDNDNAWRREVSYTNISIYRDERRKNTALAVRCLKN